MAFSARTITEYRTEVRLDIGCPGGGNLLWEDTELDRCVQRAVDDLSRFYPLEAVYEHTIVQDVTGEHWTASTVAGGFIELGNKPIEPGSETVTDSSENACVRDTDYTIDYTNGRIAHIAGGEIDSGEADCHISYKKDRLGIDISDIITNLIRITRVEYPVDKVPQQFVAFHIWNDFMYVGSQKPGESQTWLNDKEHVAIYYEKPHTAPTAAAPSYPAFLDEVICKGAGAYAFLNKAVNTEHQVVVDLAALRTALTSTIQYLDNNAEADAAGILQDITDDASKLRTRIDSILSLANTYLFGASEPSAAKYLLDGDGLINALNVGANVAEGYADYARASIQLFSGLIGEATVRVSNLRTYMEQATGYNRIADSFMAEATQYAGACSIGTALADRFRTEGLERRNEFWAILKDKAEYRKRMVSIPVRQPASAGVTKTTTTQIGV